MNLFNTCGPESCLLGNDDDDDDDDDADEKVFV